MTEAHALPGNFGFAIPKIVGELKISPRQVAAVAALLEEGNTIPFIARYRKELHGNLDEVAIGKIQERLAYHRELGERKAAILKSIDSQGKLTEELKSKIEACETKTALEDLYLPYKPKRRTRATIAKEKGLEPLAALIMGLANGNPLDDAAQFVSEEKGVKTAEEALAGARDIVAESISENADVRTYVRNVFREKAVLVSEAANPDSDEPTKFEQYYDFGEPLCKIPSHRFLAIKRGQAEGVLRVRLEVDSKPLVEHICAMYSVKDSHPYAECFREAAQDGYKRLVAPGIEVDLQVETKLKADRAAVEIFAQNLRNLLMASPLGAKRVLGIDPGLRTGCKCAVLDATGKFLATRTFYLVHGERGLLEARVDLVKLIREFRPEAIAIGNGTGGRETEAFVRDLLKKASIKDIIVVSVSEAGASVYSASEAAREEFPELDLTVRGAISIGRRLIDPLAELVKIDPKAIGVGQYQHDVYQPMLAEKLGEVVESCVNLVGVELNTASSHLLSRVSGIGPAMAKRIVKYRDENGAFKSRRDLLKVPSLGPKAFEQAAGFLRIRNAASPLDGSAVHPERYKLVDTMASDIGVDVRDLIGNNALIDKIKVQKYISAEVGEPTLKDIIGELRKPGRDPRAAFEAPQFLDGVNTIDDVKPGMKLEGVVTNVTAFGAFVDIGVHQDGLVHLSELSDNFVTDPSQVVRAGDKLKVTVLDVDPVRKRISLSAKSNPQAKGSRPGKPGGAQRRPGVWTFGASPDGKGFSSNPFAGL